MFYEITGEVTFFCQRFTLVIVSVRDRALAMALAEAIIWTSGFEGVTLWRVERLPNGKTRKIDITPQITINGDITNRGDNEDHGSNSTDLH